VSEPLRNIRSDARREPLGLRALFDAHYPSIWRLLRRLGVRQAQLDDAAQEVFWVAARRLGDIKRGSEHSFLYGVALRVASQEVRRQAAAMPLAALVEVPLLVDERPPADEQLADKEARALLDEALAALPLDLRVVLVLHELEGLEVRQIAEIETIPVGTASSRLRRAREEFSAIAKRMRARLVARGGHG
jgi:RNA polymerase sigma-70 factor, ECF subfamily